MKEEAAFSREGKEKQQRLSSTFSRVFDIVELLGELQAVLNTALCTPDR